MNYWLTHDVQTTACRCKPEVLILPDQILICHNPDRVSQALGLATYKIQWKRTEAMA